MRIFSSFIIGVALLLTFNVSARNLLQSQNRPTMDEFLAENNPLPPANPYPYVSYHQYGPDQLGAFKTKLAGIIAQLEKAYPGAIYVGVGRDSAMLADALNAFYISIGQRGRVVRLDASGDTVRNANDQVLYEFLESSGIDPQTALRGPGMVLLDGTRYNAESQSRRIMKVLYENASRLGIAARQLVRKLNFVSTAFDGFGYYPKNLIRSIDVQQYFQKEEARASAAGPAEILSLDSWSLTHGFEWHGLFGALQRENGKVTARPGAFNAQMASPILSHFYELAKLTSSPDFLKQVKAEARNLGYEFNAGPVAAEPPPPPVVAPAPGPVKPQPLSDWLKTDLSNFNALPVVDENTPYTEEGDFKLTINGFEILRWYNSIARKGAKEVGWMIIKMLNLHNAGKLRDRETRQLIRYFLEYPLKTQALLPLAAYLQRQPADHDYMWHKVRKANEDAVIDQNFVALTNLQVGQDCERLLAALQ